MWYGFDTDDTKKAKKTQKRNVRKVARGSFFTFLMSEPILTNNINCMIFSITKWLESLFSTGKVSFWRILTSYQLVKSLIGQYCKDSKSLLKLKKGGLIFICRFLTLYRKVILISLYRLGLKNCWGQVFWYICTH